MTSDTASSFHSGAKSGSDLPEQLQQQLRDGTLAAQRKWMLLAKLAMENASKLATLINQWILGRAFSDNPDRLTDFG